MRKHQTSISERPSKVDEESADQLDANKPGQKCPECDGILLRDSDTDGTVCEECGLVITQQAIDRGPEWRSFEDQNNASRVGAPVTQQMHDKGLSTNIGWRDRDANGNSLSARQRKKMSRLRTWDERFRTRDSKDRNLRHALGEIDRMGSALGVPEASRETASVIYRRALKEDLLSGRSIESVATCALYAAARTNSVARTIDELADVSRVDKLDIKRTYRYISRELNLQIPPTDPIEYVGRFASQIDCSNETEQYARQLIKDATNKGVHSGKNPACIAASALYAASRLSGESIIQPDIAQVANMSEVTIRNQYQELLAATEMTDYENKQIS